jgi:FG-GAP repeat
MNHRTAFKVAATFGSIVGICFATTAVTAVAAGASEHSASAASPAVAVGTNEASIADPGGNPGDHFGASVATAKGIAVVGAPDVSDQGVVDVYVKTHGVWSTTPTTLDDPGATADDEFGYSVAVSGKTIVVGAPGTDSFAGAAYVYVKGATTWGPNPTRTIADPGSTTGDEFGYSVAIKGANLVVGSPNYGSEGAAYIYVDNGTWPATPTKVLNDTAATGNDEFGFSVSLTGKAVIVGAPGTDSFTGAAYAYVKGATSWPTTASVSLADPGAEANDYFGLSVFVAGKNAIIGAPGTDSLDGAAYIYTRSATTGWPSLPSVSYAGPASKASEFGYSVADSHYAAVMGAYQADSDAGTTYIYPKQPTGWSGTASAVIHDPAATSGDNFGNAVAVYKKIAVVGASATNGQAGEAYVFKA